MTETFIGNSRTPVEPSLAEKLAQGLGGPELIGSMFESASALLEAHGAPDYVKEKVIALAQAIAQWSQESSAPTPAPQPAQGIPPAPVTPAPDGSQSHDAQ